MESPAPEFQLRKRKIESLKKGEDVKLQNGQWARLAEDVRFMSQVHVFPFGMSGKNLRRNKVHIPISYIKFVKMYNDKEHPVEVVS